MPTVMSTLNNARATPAAPRGAPAALLAALVTLASVAPAGEREPRTDLDRFTVIKAARVITISGKEIEDGMVVINGGKIAQVGKGLEYPLNARVIDVPGATVMPGLIHPRTRGPLPDVSRSGVNANLIAGDEYLATPGDFDNFLQAGYTAVALVPAGDALPGRATVVRTGGPDPQRKLIPVSYVRAAADKPVLRDAFTRARKEIEKVENARKEFEEKQKQAAATPAGPAAGAESQPAGSQPPATQASQPASQPAFEAPPIDPAVQPLVDLIQKKEGVRALIECGNASDYVHITELFKQLELDIAHDWWFRPTSQADLDQILPKLAESKPRLVMDAQRHFYPQSAFPNPLIRNLVAAGCEVTLAPVSDSRDELLGVRARLSELVREGLERDAALKGLTLHPAKLLGLEARLGSIEKDREADLIILDGDPFAPGARVTHVLIAGELVLEPREEAR